MYLSNSQKCSDNHVQRRKFTRFDIHCRARIRIGTRQYAGYIHNISRAGAKLRTITPIHKLGSVILRLPDLPPLRCRLRWTDSHNAGVSFELPLSPAEFSRWTQSRSTFNRMGRPYEREFAELAEVMD
jgi:hypothetical protein